MMRPTLRTDPTPARQINAQRTHAALVRVTISAELHRLQGEALHAVKAAAGKQGGRGNKK